VQIEQDASLDDYILTQSGLKILNRINTALKSKYSTRAWTITGPYGSGKSAFIVYLKSLFGDSSDLSVKSARTLLKVANPALSREFFKPSSLLGGARRGFCHALVSAGRERIEHAILKGLLFGLEHFFASRSKHPLVSEISKLIKKCEGGFVPSGDLMMKLIESTSAAVTKAKGAGLILVIDELGKCLEAAALNPESDVFILQKLAETASRSNRHPFFFLYRASSVVRTLCLKARW